jgi:hypothetical protein
MIIRHQQGNNTNCLNTQGIYNTWTLSKSIENIFFLKNELKENIRIYYKLVYI